MTTRRLHQAIRVSRELLVTGEELLRFRHQRIRAFVSPLGIHHDAVGIDPKNHRDIASRTVLLADFTTVKQNALL